jgi:hypothetical protein
MLLVADLPSMLVITSSGRNPAAAAGPPGEGCSRRLEARHFNREKPMPVSTHPDQDDDVLGPIDFLAIEFPGARITSPGFEQLLTVADQGIIRILDLERSANVLAAHSALPGPALVTPALRAMLRQPPELLLPPPGLFSRRRHLLALTLTR